MLNDTPCDRYIEVEEGSYDFDTGNGYTGVVGHFTQVLTLNLHDVIEIVQHLIYSSQKRRLLYLCVGCARHFSCRYCDIRHCYCSMKRLFVMFKH